MSVFITGAGKVPNLSLLPDGYVQLEYIESTGTQWIDTGYVPSYKTKVSAEIEITEIVKNGTPFACRGKNSTPTDPNSYGFIIPTDQKVRSTFFGTYLDGDCDSVLQRFIVVKDGNVLTALGRTLENAASTGVGISNLYIFCMNTNGTTTSQQAKMRLYGFSISENTEILRDFIPCKNEIGKIGLYDIINDKFYENAGTGTFIAGPEM